MREIPDRVGDDGVPVMPGLTGMPGLPELTVMPGLTGHLRQTIGTKVRRPLSLRRACTLSSREYVARRANQTVASGLSVGFGHEYGTPAELFFGRPEVVFRVLPIGLVLSSNNSFWFVLKIATSGLCPSSQ